MEFQSNNQKEVRLKLPEKLKEGRRAPREDPLGVTRRMMQRQAASETKPKLTPLKEGKSEARREKEKPTPVKEGASEVAEKLEKHGKGSSS
ncbi:hypothetical protein NPIL_16351 [Nephila pilipes]|uniref:Uncharacterized protein n=1 Tax=Nephila pilipes TaxID=299642 RepID=A0A8X6IDM9_NEPPI|nr:hypothetical protein NPIL_16351 [Nephila pilipes]